MNNYDNCLIVGHLSLNDMFIINGLVNYYSTLYNKVFILCKKKDIDSINQLYSDNNIIIPICIDIESNIVPFDHKIYNMYENIIKIGSHNNNWELLKSNLLIGDHPYLYFKTFYQQLNLNYELRYSYEKINRDYISEKKFYNKVMINYDGKYKFVYNLIKNDIFENNDIPIFNPYINYYNIYSKFYNLWNGTISNNIFDYSIILENAIEIHVSFNEFLSLSMLLDLSKVKNKYIYTNITNIKDYHINLIDWKIIYTS